MDENKRTRVRDLRDGNWFWIDNVIVDTYLPLIGSNAFALYCYLARVSRNGIAFPGIRTIAARTGMHRNTVRTALEMLKLAGLVDVEERYRNDRHMSNEYILRPISPQPPQELIDKTGVGEILTHPPEESTGVGENLTHQTRLVGQNLTQGGSMVDPYQDLLNNITPERVITEVQKIGIPAINVAVKDRKITIGVDHGWHATPRAVASANRVARVLTELFGQRVAWVFASSEAVGWLPHA